MGFFKKMKKHIDNLEEINSTIIESCEVKADVLKEPAAAAPEEEWVWVDGFKGTNKDMKAYDNFQYELGVDYNVAEPDEVYACSYGYHFCLNLKDVYAYYDLKNGNRFFKVRALVRKKDYEKYGSRDSRYTYTYIPIDKLAAKSIILTEEITDEKILVETYYDRFAQIDKLPDEWNSCIIQKGYDVARNEYNHNTLVSKGYSDTFAHIIIMKYGGDYIDRALAIADQEGVSMDMKVWFIFTGCGSSGC